LYPKTGGSGPQGRGWSCETEQGILEVVLVAHIPQLEDDHGNKWGAGFPVGEVEKENLHQRAGELCG